MTLDEIRTDALVHYDEPSGGKYDGDGGIVIRRIINRVYRETCRRARVGRTSGAITTVSGTREYALPSGLVALSKVLCKPVNWAEGYPLARIDFSDVSHEETGAPEKYYQVDNTYLGIDPIPNAAYALTVWYFRGPTSELAGGETPSLIPADWHQVLVYGTTAQLFRMDNGDDGQGYLKWNGSYEDELRKFMDYLAEDANADGYTGVR